ncbi:unnamed protein product [Nippostrongylus brasiliensis]|uniref:ShKT domain-containing protein n=1 Tax=Nippostrongylus brasiliensis TaxID=27835 RepID=A0A0N4YDQ0_NIPBR|nr:unnamed protein product [Nippostrongylus brasiliensis]
MKALLLFILLVCTQVMQAQFQSCRDGGVGPCVDLINPSTGVSDCPRLSYLCSDPIYYNLMTQQCAKTCNRCTDVTTSPGGTTGISDCTRMASYCTNAVYSALMRQQCPRTCGYCT